MWLKAYQRLGHFPELADVPDVAVEHVRRLLELVEHVPFGQHESARTAKSGAASSRRSRAAMSLADRARLRQRLLVAVRTSRSSVVRPR